METTAEEMRDGLTEEFSGVLRARGMSPGRIASRAYWFRRAICPMSGLRAMIEDAKRQPRK